MTSMVITVGRLLTGGADAVVEDAALVVDPDGGRIQAAGRRADVLHHSARPVLDFPHSTALPGLINGHVHLCFDNDRFDPEALADVEPHELLSPMYDAAATMLRHGVTTVRDTGDRLGAAARLRERHHPTSGTDPRPIPRLLVAGPPLTPPGGHCWFLGGTVEPDDAAITAQVDALARDGVDWIKVMVSGGHITEGGARSWESQFTRRQLDVVVAAARSHRLPVAAHAHGVEAIANAVHAGVATVEHCSMVTSSDLVPSFDPGLADTIREAGVFVSQADTRDPELFSAVLGEQAVAGWMGRARWLADHGVTLFCGTDAGVLPFDASIPTLVNHADAFRPAEILRMATTDAARALRIDHLVGRLEPRLAADVLIVNGNPLSDIAALRDIDAVVARGRLVT